MKKALALILAVLMICPIVATCVSAEGATIDLETVFDETGYKNIYIGAPVEVAPVLDGSIGGDEYTYSREIKPVDPGRTIPTDEQHTNVFTEYMAYDSEFIYYAYTGIFGNRSNAINIRAKNDYVVGTDMSGLNNNAIVVNYKWDGATPTKRTDGSAPAGLTSPVWDEDIFIATSASVVELKISRAYLAEQMGLGGASDVTRFIYQTYFNWIYYNGVDGLWGYVYTYHTLSADEKAALTAAGATTTPATIFNVAILGEAPTDWEELVEDLGLTIHVDPIDVAPVQDGVIGGEEYSQSRTTTLADLGNPTEIQSDLTEYFAHDGDFIYYAAKFTQANDNRAFWPQFKVDNKFDIFNDNSVTDNYYHARVQAQMRYLANGSTYINGGISSNCGYRAPVEGTEFVYGAKKDASNVKSYEIKIAKSYFAEINDCEPEDIKVFPYFISFHAAFDNAIKLSAEAQAKLTAAGATYVNPTCYNFVVLDGDTTATEPTDWEKVAEDNGFNIHVLPVTKAPVLDGVISDDEYPTSRTTALADLSAGAAGELQGENVVEYFGHDAEYIYYAAVYTRASANRAFWPRFKMDNSFDIFNANYGQHVNVQLRRSDVHTYQNGIGAYGSYTAPTFSSAVTYGFADVIAEAGRVDNVETFEVKIAKSYIAKANDITNDDVRVLPYYTWFHASTAVGNKMTAEQNAAITAAGGVAPAVGALSYNFMVLDGETIKVEDRISVTTNETASIRLSPSNAGIRFKSNVDTVDLIALVSKYGAENVKVGTLITLEELLGENELTADAAFQTVDVAATVATPFTRVDGVNTYAGSLTNLNPNNFAKNFAARGYIAYRADAESEWTYIYSDVTALRSAAYVANQALESGKYAEDAAALEILNAYAAAQAN